MNVVLYSTVDLSPITVIDLPMWAMEMLEGNQRVRVLVPQLVSLTPYSAKNRIPASYVSSVEIWGERLHRGPLHIFLLFTDAEEGALKLAPSYLSGQISGLQKSRHDAFVNGFLAAMETMR